MSAKTHTLELEIHRRLLEDLKLALHYAIAKYEDRQVPTEAGKARYKRWCKLYDECAKVLEDANFKEFSHTAFRIEFTEEELK